MKKYQFLINVNDCIENLRLYICLIQISFDFSKVIFLLFSDNCMYNSNREGKSFFVNSLISIFFFPNKAGQRAVSALKCLLCFFLFISFRNIYFCSRFWSQIIHSIIIFIPNNITATFSISIIICTS